METSSRIHAPPKQDSFRQTRLTGSSRANNAELNSQEVNSTSSGEMVGNDHTLKDITHMLITINSKFDDVKSDMSDIKESYSSLKIEMHELSETITDLKEENKALKEENVVMRTRLETVEKKTDDLESGSKRNNIIIHEIHRKEDETRQECEELVCEMITDKLELAETIQFDRVHRLNAKPYSPIVARCTFYKYKGKKA